LSAADSTARSPASAAPGGSAPVVPWALYAGLAFTTASMLLIQQFLTRVFTIQFNSGLAFLAISITFVGLGSAGVAVYVLPGFFAPARIPRQVPILSLAYAVLLVGGFLGMLALDEAAQQASAGVEQSLPTQVLQVLGASLVMLPALFAVGLVISLLLRAHSARVNRLYGADLVGGSIGCLLVLPLMRYVGGDHGIFVIAGMAALGSALLAHAHGQRGTLLAASAATVLACVGPILNRDLGLVDVRSHRTTLDEVEAYVVEDHELRREWNELARLGFFAMEEQDSIYVRIDSSCQTSVPSLAPEHVASRLARADIERLPYVLDRHRRYLELGAGGGQGLVLADALGSERIAGVEINRGIVASSMGVFPDFGIAPMLEPGRCDLYLDEGRSWSRRTDERFDAVTITFIQTRAANSSAAFALSEANLFTVEAFREFLGLLEEDGLFYVYRQGGNEVLRLVSMAREAFAPLGVTDIGPHLYAARRASNHSVLLMSRSPFRPEELAKLDAACDEMGLEILFTPSGRDAARPPNPLLERLREQRARGALEIGAVVDTYHDLVHAPEYQSLEATYIRSPDPQAFQAEYPVDVRAPTDSRPYYFFYGLDDWRDWGMYFDLAGVGILGGTVILLFWMALAFSALVALLILLPLLLLRRRERAPIGTGLAVVGYFSGLGLGYIAVQISFIQRFSLFLGHPVFAISVVLMAFLLSSGLGSLSSDRLFRRGWMTIPRTVVALGLLLLAYNVLLPAIFHSSLITLPVAVRIVFSTLLILPLAFLMGLLFPQGIRLVDASSPQLSPWAWGANSATSVVGSILALILAIHFGFSAVAVTAAVLYAALCLPSAAILRRAAAR
jgi:hypothetical protein